MSVIGDQRALRLDRAMRGFREDRTWVSEAARRTGYDHPANFATAFSRRYGLKPSEVRGRGRGVLVR